MNASMVQTGPVTEHAYSGTQLALLTRHGKERVLGPAFAAELRCEVVLVGGYDTDRLGTFTRDVIRPGSQLEVAREKARIGMAQAGLPRALSSEGSFVPGPLGLG